MRVVSTFNAQGSIASEKRARESRVSYVQVTVCSKVQMDVQQSVPGVQC